MSSISFTIERLHWPISESDLQALSWLLVTTVKSGAAVSFLAALSLDDATDWWRETFIRSSPGAVFLVARDAGEIVGAVQLHPAWAPNQPHRAEVVKLLVDRRVQRSGLGTQLMHAIEAEARSAGFTLLTLDAKRGTPAESLYRKLGWIAIGSIPNYALDPNGTTNHDAVFFYKNLK